MAQLAAGGTIRVSVASRAGRIEVAVENPSPEQPARSGGHQMALENIGQRLQALYGSEGRLQVERPGGDYRVELSYPTGEFA